MRRTALLLASTALVVLLTSGVALATVASQIGTTAAPGTTIVVNTQEDELNTDGDCSLKEAIEAADTNAAVDGCEAGSATDRDAIHFALGKEATITLGSSLPAITDASRLTINGQKAEISVSGRGTYRPFEVSSGGHLHLNHLTVTDGSAYGGG